MTSGIYAIVNLTNGKKYIGSSICIAARWAQHRHHLRKGTHHSAHLQNAWRKYGESRFDFVILEECPTESLIELEAQYLDTKPEYNFGTDPQAPWRGRKHSEASKAKMSASRRGRTLTEEHKAKTSQTLKGRKKTPQHAAKIGIVKRKPVVRISDDGDRKLYDSLAAAEADGFSSPKISRACSVGGRHGGYRWERV